MLNIPSHKVDFACFGSSKFIYILKHQKSICVGIEIRSSYWLTQCGHQIEPGCISNDPLDHIVSFTFTSLGLLCVQNLFIGSITGPVSGSLVTNSKAVLGLRKNQNGPETNGSKSFEQSCLAFLATYLFEMNVGRLQLGTYTCYQLEYFENFEKRLVGCKFGVNDRQTNKLNSNWIRLRVVLKFN